MANPTPPNPHNKPNAPPPQQPTPPAPPNPNDPKAKLDPPPRAPAKPIAPHASAAPLAPPGTPPPGTAAQSRKDRHDAIERKRAEDAANSERATQLRNEHATNVQEPEARGAVARNLTPAIQASCARLQALTQRLFDLAIAPPAGTTTKRGEDPVAKARTEVERIRGLINREINYLRSLGKDPEVPIPTPPPEPILEL